jgi:murein DD-endopeptidase MepM/ murein hydrolase activator NlpD
MTLRQLVSVLVVAALSSALAAEARTLPRRGAARKPRTFEIQPPFPCGTEFKVACAYGCRAHKRTNSKMVTNDYYAIDLIRNEASNGAGKSVVAVAPGVVRFAGWTHGGWAPYGKAVYIEHDFVDREGKRYESIYAHLDHVKVRDGQRVDAGTPVGTLGGSSKGERHRFGPHLHFAMYRNAGRSSLLGGGQAVVPEPFGGLEDVQVGMRAVACQKPTLPVALGPIPADAVGGLTE